MARRVESRDGRSHRHRLSGTDVTGDESTILSEYKPNATTPAAPAHVLYLVGAPVHVGTFQGVGNTMQLTDGLTFYDGQSDWHAPPTVGLVTQSSSWLDTANAYTVTTYGYDAFGNRTSVTDANGNTTTTIYDSTFTTFAVEVRNALYSTSTAAGQKQHALTSWEYRCGAPLTKTDGNDQVVTTTYDKLCRVIQVASPGGDGSAQGNVETRSYDHLYNGTTVTASTQYVYRTATAPNASGPSYSYRYIDGRGRTWQTQARGSSGDVYTRTTFDGRGSAISTSTPTYWNGTGAFPGIGPTRTLDDLGRPVKVTHPDASYDTWSYGPNTVTVVDELGHTMTETTDARGHVVNHTEYDVGTPRTTQYTYDGRGALVTVQDPAGNVTQSFVNSLGLAYKLVDPDRGTIIDDYDAVGHVVQEIDALGQVTQYAYDALGRMTTKTTRVGSAEAVSISWGYDERYGTGYANMGRRTSATDPYGTQTEDFNAAGLVVKRTRAFKTVATPTVGSIVSLSNGDKLIQFAGGSPGEEYEVQATTDFVSWTTLGSVAADASGAFSYKDARHLPISFYRCMVVGEAGSYTFYFAYDAGGRLKGTHYPDGDVIGIDPQNPGSGTALAYDNAGRLNSTSAIAGGTLVSSVSYDALGNALQQNNANGTVVTRTFDSNRNWLTSVSATNGGATLFSLSYGRDTEGKILSTTSDAASESWSYGYDGLHRLTNATNVGSASDSQTFTYDAIGNMTSNSRIGSYAYRGGGGGCSDDATSGQPHAVSCAGGVSYKYDANGNMVSGSIDAISYDGNNMPVSAGDYGYTYSADNDRLTVSNGGETTVFLGGNYEISPTGVVTKVLPFGIKRKGTSGNWTTYYLHADGQGSTRVVTDASGAVQKRMSYRPYGEVLSQSTSFDPSLGYAGEKLDGNGLIYLHARYLDPKLGRFISADPTSSDGLNRYAYVRDNPISFVDHSGYGSTPNETYLAAIYAGGIVAQWADAPRQYGTIGAATAVENGNAAFYSWFTGGGDTYDGHARVGSPQFTAQLVVAAGSLVPVGEMAELAQGAKAAMNIGIGSVDEIGAAVQRLDSRGISMGQPWIFQGGDAAMGGTGVQGKLAALENGEVLAQPAVNDAGVLIDGHHTAVAYEIANPGELQLSDLANWGEWNVSPQSVINIYGSGVSDLLGTFSTTSTATTTSMVMQDLFSGAGLATAAFSGASSSSLPPGYSTISSMDASFSDTYSTNGWLTGDYGGGSDSGADDGGD